MLAPLRTFFRADVREDPRRCRVCGNLTLPRARRLAHTALVIVIGALSMYIVLDVVENGRLDASLYAYLRAQWHEHHRDTTARQAPR